MRHTRLLSSVERRVAGSNPAGAANLYRNAKWSSDRAFNPDKSGFESRTVHHLLCGIHKETPMYLLRNFNLDLYGMDNKSKSALLKLLARVSEASYRRGLQQGRVFEAAGAFKVDPGTWRYERSLDSSPWGEANKKCMTAIEGLDCEYGASLRDVGLTVPHSAD